MDEGRWERGNEVVEECCPIQIQPAFIPILLLRGDTDKLTARRWRQSSSLESGEVPPPTKPQPILHPSPLATQYLTSLALATLGLASWLP